MLSAKQAKRLRVGTLADALYDLRDQRLALSREVKRLQGVEREVGDVLREKLVAANLTRAAGKQATVSVSSSCEPQVEDWDVLYQHIAQEDAWDLLQRRLSGAAFRERWNDDLIVPGVTTVNVSKLSITKRGA